MHNCSTVIIHCMDFRLINKIREWVDQNNLTNDTDIISIAGASKALSEDNKEIQNFILNQINVSYLLHNARKVILMHHSDCGAYGSYNFIDEEEEFAKQLEDMGIAEEIIKNSFDDIEVQKVWIQMNDHEGRNVEFINL
ncbi:MAG: hypothetical protein PHG24_02285 [Candidatus Pacebacteria bacterium]|nr:hypothetical protein [Candidatus Paceibacterota bacterium]